MTRQNKGGANDGKDKPGVIKRPWLFRSQEGKGSHVLSGTETTDSNGKKVITLKKTKPGNSNN